MTRSDSADGTVGQRGEVGLWRKARGSRRETLEVDTLRIGG
jgi:hypothetical protein